METAVMFIQPISFLYAGVGSSSLYIMFTIFEGESVQ
jgi:hypothetical protein